MPNPQRSVHRKHFRSSGSMPWKKVLFQGIAGSVLSAIIVGGLAYSGVMVTIRTEGKLQKRIVASQMVLDILASKDSTLYNLLPSLIRDIDDPDWIKIVGVYVLGDTNVPSEIRTDIETQVLEASFDRKQLGIQIIHLDIDTISKSRARLVNDFLSSQGFSCVITPLSKDWFKLPYGATETDSAEIRFSKAEMNFAENVKRVLDTEDTLGAFKLKQISEGQSKLSISILLPDQVTGLRSE